MRTARWLAASLLLGVPAASLYPQDRVPTVGDTVWLTRTVAVPAGYAVRAPEWEAPDPIELLGRARVTSTADSAQIAYPVAVWRPGRHQIELPGPLLLGPGGTVDSLPGARLRLEIASVLPPVPADSILPPQPRAGLVSRQVVTPVPLFLLWAAALILLLPVHLWWRRRNQPTRAPPPVIPAEALEPPLHRWADAGEYRAVAGISTLRLRTALAQRVAAAHPALDTERVLAEIAAARPQWPIHELGDLLRALDDARFGVSPSPDVLELSRSSVDMRERLLKSAA